MSAVQLEQPVNSPIYDARQQFTAADKPLRVGVNFLSSSTAAVIESALLMLLIGWIDYKTTDFAIMVFYFGPVVLATWRAGRKAGWFIAALCGATVLMADLMVPRSGRVLALAYINAGIECETYTKRHTQTFMVLYQNRTFFSMDGKKLPVRTDKIHAGALGSIYHYRRVRCNYLFYRR